MFNFTSFFLINLAQDGKTIDCCDDVLPLHPECYATFSGPGDPNFDKYNISCMSFVRSAAAPTGSFGPRQQLNQVTSFIDGSVVYGSLDNKVQRLRSSKIFSSIENEFPKWKFNFTFCERIFPFEFKRSQPRLIINPFHHMLSFNLVLFTQHKNL